MSEWNQPIESDNSFRTYLQSRTDTKKGKVEPLLLTFDKIFNDRFKEELDVLKNRKVTQKGAVE